MFYVFFITVIKALSKKIILRTSILVDAGKNVGMLVVGKRIWSSHDIEKNIEKIMFKVQGPPKRKKR